MVALGAVLPAVSPLLKALYKKYTQLKEGKKLCRSLHSRLVEFAKELDQIDPVTLQAEALLPRLQMLIQECMATVTQYASERNVINRVMKVSKFSDDIKLLNERLDSLIALLSVKQTAILVEWRNQFKLDVDTMMEELSCVYGLCQKIWLAIDELPTLSEFRDLVLTVKRDLPDATETAAPSLERGLHRIIAIAEKDFPDGKAVKKPPTWLIAADEVVTEGPIGPEGQTNIFVGRWQGVQVAVKKFDLLLDENPVFDKHLAVWRTLLHPNVAQLYGAGSRGGYPFFVYEYASNRSLYEYRAQRRPQELWHLLHQAALGLLYLHRNRVVHGNLSCSKLLVTDTGRVKLFGFGASYIRDRNQSNSIQPETREEFAAPECVFIGPNGQSLGLRHSPSFASESTRSA
ncbi:hypothetical protein PRIC1_009812 [Phytophthora ramorum]